MCTTYLYDAMNNIIIQQIKQLPFGDNIRGDNNVYHELIQFISFVRKKKKKINKKKIKNEN